MRKNAYTSKEIWTMMGFGGMFGPTTQIFAADGFVVFLNSYDMQIYSIGKGPSVLTVTAPDVAASFGSPVVIRGSVTDISAGTKQPEQAARFPAGVPAVSDASMKDWMEYVYMQKPRPMDTVGVDVILTVIDPNNNVYDIGKATSDSSGKYSLMWQPPVPGKYTVIATFAGSESYWPSYSEAAFGITEAAPTASPIQQISLPPTEMYFAATGVAIIAAIATLLILKKRP